MPRLNAQDKLALSLTSAGSQRNLAGALGISPRALGRYLKGERSIPGYLLDSINQAFKIHRTIAKQQAAVLGAPYDPKAPVFIERPLIQVTQRGYEMKRGKAVPFTRKIKVPGQRLIVQNIDYVRSKVREQVALGILQSPAVGGVTARTSGPAALAIRSRVSGFEKFQQQLRDRELRPDSEVKSYTERSGKVTPFDAPGTARDMELKLERMNYPQMSVDSLVFTLPRQPDETKPRKRGRKARR
ncbi:MAG: XRE family transcriptional regulator [Betaproteobacteria bacterium]|nr:XRE family transcriptional regulator [Betaproteobacteria bacterium]